MIPTRITKPYIAICEGTADEKTFNVLIEDRKIRQIEFVSPDESCQGYGKSSFYSVLTALTTRRGFEDLKGILIIQDSDDAPKMALREMKAQIKKANEGFEPEEKFSIPQNLLTPTFSDNRPPLMLTTIPWIDRPGTLETLIFDSLKSKFPEILDCLNDYCRCTTHVLEWSPGKQSKMHLACMVAAICKKDPTTSIQNMWSKSEFKDLIKDSCFDQVADLFRSKTKYFKLSGVA